MDLKIDEIMDLSLDDYIAMSKKSTNDSVTKHSEDKDSLRGNFKDSKFGRRKGNIDEEEEDDEELLDIQTPKEELEIEEQIEEIETGIWKGPDSTTAYIDCHDSQRDLREKLNNSNRKNVPQISAVQYRLMAPNNSATRPRGIPTLLPLDFQMNKNNWVQNRGNRRNRGNRGSNNFQRGPNNTGNNQGASMGGVQQGRVQKNRPQDIECKNFRFSLSGNNNNNKRINLNNSQTRARNMIIETPSSSINLVSSPPLNSSFHVPQTMPERSYNNRSRTIPIGNLTPQAEAVLNLNSVDNQTNSSSNESLKSLLGFQGNVSGDMMPVFANRLMEYIQNGLQNPVVHKPVYDMKIQKDIHEIQKKPLLYKCPGGEVVSSDGPGVNCKIIPRTSGVSLNCRFA